MTFERAKEIECEEAEDIKNYENKYCSVCEISAKFVDLTFVHNEYVCNNCLNDYLLSISKQDDYDSFVDENKIGYYKKWFFDNLEEIEQIEIIINQYEKDKLKNELQSDRKNFCLENENFITFLRSEYL